MIDNVFSDFETCNYSPEPQSKIGFPAISQAAINGDEELLELLMRWGADLNPQDASGNTSCQYSRKEIVQRLLATAGPGLLNIRDRNGQTPFHICCHESPFVGGGTSIGDWYRCKYTNPAEPEM